MESTYQKNFPMGQEGLSGLLHLVQEAAGDHSTLLGAGWDELLGKGLFWAVIRHRVKLERLPRRDEIVAVTTWPMPTTRSAYPRATEARDADGKLLFRAVSLWVLMDIHTRAMVLPKRSGVTVEGVVMGTELAFPGSLGPVELSEPVCRTVCKEDLDVNGHVNNCRYLDWVEELLTVRHDTPKEFTLCYLSETLEGQKVSLGRTEEGDLIRIEVVREKNGQSAGHSRVFAAELQF